VGRGGGRLRGRRPGPAGPPVSAQSDHPEERGVTKFCTLTERTQKIYARIHEWRNRAIEHEHPYVYLDGVWLSREFGGEVRPVAVLVAIGVNADGFREILVSVR
jgi:hypothetical protein